jgi:phenylalanyl-tRNA synthetase beta chain
MRFNEAWLRQWVNPEVGTEELVHQLTMAGLEVDAVEAAAPAFTGVVVGEVRSVRAHPEADKLTLCEVHDGDGICRVVCGAANVETGMKAPFARVGAVLPGDVTIERTELRGQPSQGMLCGASELGLEDLEDGLLALPPDAPAGRDLRSYLELDDQVIEVDLTPNRGDCLSLRGVAREVAALNRITVTGPALHGVPAVHEERLDVHLDDPDACPRYLGRVLKGVNLEASSPLWLVERLRRAGLRPIDPVVDVTNYVLLELGQPLHAFDVARLSGGIRVRRARAGEALTLLDGQTIEADPEALMIADDEQALALAGVMGGASSAVSRDTGDIFLECAFFAPRAMAGRARAHGLQTDSSHRFERGVDPDLQNTALERATALIMDVCGGEPGPVTEAVEPDRLPAEPEIELRADQVNQLLGEDIEARRVEDMLARLGLEVTTRADGQGWTVLTPSWRFDLERAEDLIEEVARLHGYDRLPSRLPAASVAAPMQPEGRVSRRRLADQLVDRGYREVITYSFVDPSVQALVDPDGTSLPLANPLSTEQTDMRTSIWPGLLTTARHNLNRQASRLRLFEMGQRFVTRDQGLAQESVLSGLVMGSADPAHWHAPTRSVDFFDLKGDVEALLASTRGEIAFSAAEHPALHPGQSAELICDGRPCGWLGRLHPALARKLDVPAHVYLFELELDAIVRARVPEFRELSDQPVVRRDLAFIVSREVPAGDLLDGVRRACDATLRDVRIFDVYQGDRVEQDCKSLALGLTFQDRSSTLGEAEINTRVEAVVSQLKQEFNAVLRDVSA